MAHSGSTQRNPLIVNTFRNINYVEKTGIGMNTIYTALKGDHFEKPVIDSNEESNIFRIRLKFYQAISESAQKFIDNIRDSLTISLTDHDISALIHVLEYKRITNTAYREVNYVDSLTASKGLKKLVDYGLLIKHGNSAKTTEYLASEIFNKLRQKLSTYPR